MMTNIPTRLTWLRIFAIPIIVIVYLLPINAAHFIAAILFILAAATDWLDGYLARILKQASALGAFLDPVADKLLVAVVLILILFEEPSLLLSLFAMIIIAREILVSALREWLATTGERAKVAVSLLGKYKTTFQLLGIISLLVDDTRPHGFLSSWAAHFYFSGLLLLLVAVLLTLWSCIIYLRAAWPSLTSEREQQ